MGFALHPEAIVDLDDIHGYINRFNFSSANRVLEEVIRAFESLSLFPHQGHRRPDLTSRPLRFKVIRNYLIAYAPDKKPIWIVGVIDGRMNPRVIASILRERE
jgi:plasmid stabilization system protein ParE